MKQNFEIQQKQFLEVFKGFDFNDNFLLSARFTCDYYRGEEFSGILNSMPIEFVTTVFCDALLNAALFPVNTTLMKTLSREHFVYNCYNVFHHDCNITNKNPQYFFSVLASKNDPRIVERIYTTTRSYFGYFFPLIAQSIGMERASRLMVCLKTDRDLAANNYKLAPEIISAYMKAISDSVEGLGLEIVETV